MRHSATLDHSPPKFVAAKRTTPATGSTKWKTKMPCRYCIVGGEPKPPVNIVSVSQFVYHGAVFVYASH